MTSPDRRGFTLVELLIVAVLGALVVGVAYQALVATQRSSTIQTAQIQGQQAMRAGIDILFSELREISRAEGDILIMEPERIRVRAMRAFGLVCNVSALGSPILVKKVGRFFESGDSVVVLADNDPETASDDTILSGVVSSLDTAQSCTGTDQAQSLVIPSLVAALANDTVRVGAPVRGFTIYTYGLESVNGEYYLTRRYGTTSELLVGPVSSRGISFTYLDSLGAVTTNPTVVSRIGVTLRVRSSVVDERGLPIADSISTAIHLRN